MSEPSETPPAPNTGPGPGPGTDDDRSQVPIEHLMAQAVDRASEIISVQERLRTLLAANRSIVGELSLSAVLERIVTAARTVAGARYAALGVIAADGTLEQFVHTGMDQDVVDLIGELPKGRGVLGALIDDPQPIRLTHIRDDPRSSGFPPHHPPMNSFLGVPIRSHNAVFGNLYLTDRTDGQPFTAEDEELTLALAATAGIAIENARLYEESRRRQEWLRASGEISQELLTTTHDDQRVLRNIADSVKRLTDADVVTLVLPDANDPQILEVAVATGEGAADLEGMRFGAENSLSQLAMRQRHGILINDIGETSDFIIHIAEVVPIAAVMAVPLTGEQNSLGAILVGRLPDRRPLTQNDREMAEAFSSQAAIALELSGARADQQRLAVLEDRDRIARDLHDHVIQQLFATGLSVQSAATSVTNPLLQDRLARTVDDIDATIRQIRTTIFALRGTAPLQPQGLRSQVMSIMERLGPLLPNTPDITFTGPVDTMISADVANDVCAVVREGLTNISKHAPLATRISVNVAASADRLIVTVQDNGGGLATTNSHQSGLENLGRRAAQANGKLQLTNIDEEGPGLQLLWTVPLSP